MRYIRILMALSILSLCSCVSLVTFEEKTRALNSFPIRPDIPRYTKPPVIERQGENYLVTDEMVKRAIKFKEYDDRIENWKKSYDVR